MKAFAAASAALVLAAGFAGPQDSGQPLQVSVVRFYQPANSYNAPSSSDASYAGFDSGISNGSYGFAYGGGIDFHRSPTSFGFGVDYAVKSFGPLGNTSVVSVNLSW